MKTAKRILRAIDGDFGRRELKPQYRGYWRFITYGTITFSLLKFLLIPFLQWWDGVINFLNYVIWG